jgi:hypothetical protein
MPLHIPLTLPRCSYFLSRFFSRAILSPFLTKTHTSVNRKSNLLNPIKLTELILLPLPLDIPAQQVGHYYGDIKLACYSLNYGEALHQGTFGNYITITQSSDGYKAEVNKAIDRIMVNPAGIKSCRIYSKRQLINKSKDYPHNNITI